ncbi:hypothetical protein MSG28_012229, partial [Choristoneura fumiferana]
KPKTPLSKYIKRQLEPARLYAVSSYSFVFLERGRISFRGGKAILAERGLTALVAPQLASTRHFLSQGVNKHSRRHGRDQEEDAGDEAGEGQRAGPRAPVRAGGKGCQPSCREAFEENRNSFAPEK